MSLLIWLLRKEREAEWKKNRAGTAGILILTGKRYWKAGWQENTVMGVSFVKADVMKDLFSVLDNFERALQAPTNAETKAFLDGFVMIHQNLMAMLSKHGLAVIDAVGKPFDPNYHQAIMRVPSDEYEDDTVCEVLQTGYTVDGKTVRPAMVKVVHND